MSHLPRSPQRMALEVGRNETREAFEAFAHGRFRVLIGWFAGSMLVALALLFAALAVSYTSEPQADVVFVPIALDPDANREDFFFLIWKNFLVLLLHLLVCVASYLARRSVPLQAQYATGINRWVHDNAGPAAMWFVGFCTIFSLGLQATVLGADLAQAASSLGYDRWQLLLGVSLHGFPELSAVFLPLAACLILGRRKDWNSLMAACGLCALAAMPIIIVCSAIEVWVTRMVF